MKFARWTLGTLDIPADELSPAIKEQLVKDYQNTCEMFPGRVVIVRYGKTPEGILARRIDVAFPPSPRKEDT